MKAGRRLPAAGRGSPAPVRVYGIDFTSRPTRRKPITCLACELDGDRLRAGPLEDALEKWTGFEGFEAALSRPGPWIAGLDFPFGQARRLVETIGWPRGWAGYVDHVAGLTRAQFRAALDTYRADRAPGDKEHRRACDVATGAVSPQKLYGTPVALMFYEGAPRLRAAGVTIPALQDGDPARVVVEAYPGVLARRLIGRVSYKQDARRKQTADRHRARVDLLRALRARAGRAACGLRVEAPDSLVDDPGGDTLDALLCAVQAAWAWTQRHRGYGAPQPPDPLEGWIADPRKGVGDK